MTLDAMGAAELLAGTPLLIIHGERDAYCSPALAQAVYDRKRGDKEILWLDSGLHTDLYDNQPYVSQAAAAAAGFFQRRLRRPRAPGTSPGRPGRKPRSRVPPR